MYKQMDIFVLDNGIVFNHIYTECNSIFRMELIIRKGSLDEDPGQIGFAHFIEHLMSFFPSEKYPDSVANQKNITKRGIQLNAWTSENTCGYYMEGLSKYAGLIIDMIMNNYVNPVLDPKVFEQEKNAVISELHAIINDTWYNLDKMIRLVNFKNTNLEFTVEQEKTNVKQAAKLKNIMEFRNKWYKPEFTSIIVLSNMDSVKLRNLISYMNERFFSDASKYPPKKPLCYNYFDASQQSGPQQSGPQQSGPQQSVTKQEPTIYYTKPSSTTKTVKIIMTFDVDLTMFDDRAYVIDYIDVLLTNGVGSRLYYDLRTILGAVYHVSSGHDLSPNNTYFSKYMIETETSQENAIDVVNCILFELQKLITDGNEYITDDEFSQYNDYIELLHIKNKCNLFYSQKLKMYQHNLIWGHKMNSIKTILEKRKKITKNEVFELAKQIFRPEKLKIFYSSENPVLNKFSITHTHIEQI